jgi:hypothetical protein
MPPLPKPRERTTRDAGLFDRDVHQLDARPLDEEIEIANTLRAMTRFLSPADPPGQWPSDRLHR